MTSSYTGIAFGEVGKVLGEKWKALGPEDKAKFEKLAAADKERWVVFGGGQGGTGRGRNGEEAAIKVEFELTWRGGSN